MLNLSSPHAERPTRRGPPPLDKDQRLVTTPYGRGLVLRTRPDDGIYETQLLEWANHNANKKPILYSSTKHSSVPPKVGDDVLCLYGRGRVIAVFDDTLMVQLSSWRLTGRSLVTCYLNRDNVEVVRKKTVQEMDAYERVAYAQELKSTASTLFSKKDYSQALETYAKAVDVVRWVQHDANSSNELRADLVVVLITCYNNAATCCALSQNWTEALRFSKNALVLLDALYEKRGMRIHTILQKEGFQDIKLFGEWKVKSLLLMARAMAEQGDLAGAMNLLKQAHDVIVTYTTAADNDDDASTLKSIAHLHGQGKEVKRLHATCAQRKKAERKKEKQRAMAMFQSPDKESPKEEPTKAVVTPSPAAKKDDTRSSDNTINDLEELDELPSSPSRIPVKKSVSFADDTKEGREILEQEEEIDDEEPAWYEEHKEALILSAAVGLSALSIVLLRSRK